MEFTAFHQGRRREAGWVDYYLRPTGERKSLYEETRKTSEISRADEALSQASMTSGSISRRKKKKTNRCFYGIC